MTEVTRHEPGSFCWAELATTDTKAAKGFYADLFGWTFDDSPMGPGPDDVYTRLQVSGRDVGALYRMMKEQESQGVPPNWLVYVAVASADDAASKAGALGGRVLAPAFAVQDFGRMAMLQDPEGATFAVWQAGTHTGAQRVGEPGAFCWMELQTRDAPEAKRFYTGLFDWALKESANPAMPYTEILRRGQAIGGILAMGAEMAGIPPHWTVYFQVSDCDAVAARAKKLGATLHVPPTDIEKVGRFAVIQDPQGAGFCIFRPA
jgi:hypothetical protein